MSLDYSFHDAQDDADALSFSLIFAAFSTVTEKPPECDGQTLNSTSCWGTG